MKGTKKLLGVMRTKKILLHTPLIKWYLQYSLRLTTVPQLVEYKPGKPFLWFPEEVAGARRKADKDPLKKLGNIAKLKGNSFYGKMIEDFGRHKSTKFTREERDVDKALRSPFFFDNLEEIGGAYEIKEIK